MNLAEAKITWRSPNDGGRSAPPPGPKYSTVARFSHQGEEWRENAWSLVLHYVDAPNQKGSHKVKVGFLAPEGPSHWLKSNTRFELYEGNRVVAEGSILKEVVPEETVAERVQELPPRTKGRS